jgi:hypothetical protein
MHYEVHLDALFLVNAYNGFKFCPSLFETVDIHVPIQNFRGFPLFTILVPHVKLAPLLDVHQPQIQFYILIYLINIWLHLVIF